MKHAASLALVRGIRTFAQTASAALAGVTLYAVNAPEVAALGQALALALIVSALAGLGAFLQNLAENLPE